MSNNPFEFHTISDPNELYGRESLLKRLTILAKRKENTEVIGARRFGKTCVLKSMQTKLRCSNDIDVYPIYLDFKKDNVRGTAAVYRYMISELVKSLYEDGIFTEQKAVGLITIIPTNDHFEIEEQLLSISASRLQALLERLITLFAAEMKRTILFMIDEYEYLFKYGLDTPSGFFRLRDLSSSLIDESLRPFCFWIAGVLDWDELCTDIGSGELNQISAIESVYPIEKDAFSKMWRDECALIENLQKKMEIEAFLEIAYEKSGGVPFYAKQIGAFLLRNDAFPDYSLSKSSFRETMNEKTMKPAEMSILKTLAKKEEHLALSDALTSLKNRGIVTERKDGAYFITIGFLKDYLLAETNNPQQENSDAESGHLTDEIFKLIENINKSQINRRYDAIFKLPIETISFYKDLAIPCYSAERIQDFSSALYLIFFEWTKKDYPRERLPEQFRDDIEAQYIDVARHTLGRGHLLDDFVQKAGRASKEDMLIAMTGSAVEPYKSEEFYAIQIAFLHLFIATLKKIRKYFIDNPNPLTQRKSNICKLKGKISRDQLYVVAQKISYRIDNKKGFADDCNPNTYLYDDNEDVFFEVKTVGTYRYAINVRPAAEQ